MRFIAQCISQGKQGKNHENSSFVRHLLDAQDIVHPVYPLLGPVRPGCI